MSRLARRSRRIAFALIAVLLAMFSAAGFAGAKMWDGRDSELMPLDMAVEVAQQGERADLRESGLGQVMAVARQSIQALLDLRHDPQLGDSAKIYLGRLRALVPDPGSTGAAILSAKDRALATAERATSLRIVYRDVSDSLVALRDLARDPELSATATELLARLDKLLDRVLAESR